jgi:uncharacterized protein YbjT (DUF2867 family)
MAADDVATAVERVAVGDPINGIVEIGGPEPLRFADFVQRGLDARHDPRHVVVDADARYFGAVLAERSLVPDAGARLSETNFDDWLGQSAVRARP